MRGIADERLEHLTIYHGRHTSISHALAGGRTLVEVRDADREQGKLVAGVPETRDRSLDRRHVCGVIIAELLRHHALFTSHP